VINLVKAEFRRLTYSKINRILLVAVLLLPWFYAQEFYRQGRGLLLSTDTTGKSPLTTIQEIDEKMHAYAGVMDETWLEKYQADGKKASTYTAADLEREYGTNKRHYGENWEELCQRAAAGEARQEEIDELFPMLRYLDYIQDGSHYYLEVFLQQGKDWDIVNGTYQIYGDWYSGNSLYYFSEDCICPIYNTESQALLEHLVNHDVLATQTDHLEDEKWQLAKKMEKKQGDYYFDSTFPNAELENALCYSFNAFILLMLAYVFSSMFTNEQRMSEVLLSCKNGRKVLAVKFFVALLTAVFLSVLSITGIFLMSCHFLPVRDFGLKGVVGYLNDYQTHYLFSYGTTIIMQIITIILDYCVVSFLTIGLSYMTKNSLLTFGIMALVILLPQFSADTYASVIPFLFRLMPSYTINGTMVAQNLSDMMVIHGTLWFKMPVVWLIYMILCLAVSAGIYLHVKKTSRLKED